MRFALHRWRLAHEGCCTRRRASLLTRRGPSSTARMAFTSRGKQTNNQTSNQTNKQTNKRSSATVAETRVGADRTCDVLCSVLLVGHLSGRQRVTSVRCFNNIRKYDSESRFNTDVKTDFNNLKFQKLLHSKMCTRRDSDLLGRHGHVHMTSFLCASRQAPQVNRFQHQKGLL
jgi:hypothetical protein